MSMSATVRAGRAPGLVLLLALALGCSGCSLVWVDEAGRCHLLGLNHIRLAPAPEGVPVAGISVAVATFGLTAISLPEETHFTLGYARQEFALLRDDALVVGPPLASGRHRAIPADREQDHDRKNETAKADRGRTALPAACPPR